MEGPNGSVTVARGFFIACVRGRASGRRAVSGQGPTGWDLRGSEGRLSLALAEDPVGHRASEK